MNVLKPERKLTVLAALVEGNSIRSVSRMTGVHKTTIMRLLVEVGERCQAIMDRALRNLECQNLQVDEIWTFCRKKQARLAYEERFDVELGDQYAFVDCGRHHEAHPSF